MILKGRDVDALLHIKHNDRQLSKSEESKNCGGLNKMPHRTIRNGAIRRCGLGGNMLPKVGYEISDAQTRLSVVFSLPFA